MVGTLQRSLVWSRVLVRAITVGTACEGRLNSGVGVVRCPIRRLGCGHGQRGSYLASTRRACLGNTRQVGHEAHRVYSEPLEEMAETSSHDSHMAPFVPPWPSGRTERRDSDEIPETWYVNQ